MPTNPYQCPITLSTMKDPVLAPDGYSYEREAITQWIEEHGVSPQTRQPMTVNELVTNRALLELIQGSKEKRPSHQLAESMAQTSLADVSASAAAANAQAAPKTAYEGPSVEKVKAATEKAARYSPEILYQTLSKSTKAKLLINKSSKSTTARLNIATPDPTKEEVQQSLTTPVHICCVVDISGSMDEPAITKDESGSQTEDVGLSILDIVKFAVIVTAESLNPQDKLSIVTYSDESAIVLEPTCMDSHGKKLVVESLANVKPRMRTNLFAGISEGVELTSTVGSAYLNSVFVLTDGLPNVHPPLGYDRAISKLLAKYPIYGSLSTFGFGYNLDSKLLLDIAKWGGGYFSFIPDSGFTGTCFINAMANARCIFGVKPKICIHEGNVSLADMDEKKLKPKKNKNFFKKKKKDDDDADPNDRPKQSPTLDGVLEGTLVTHTEKKKKGDAATKGTTTFIHLSPLRYGTPIDVLLRPELVNADIKIDLVFETAGGKKIILPAEIDHNDDDNDAKIYHETRVNFAKNISEVASINHYSDKNAHAFVANAEATDDPAYAALCEDMNGQATTAVSQSSYFTTWGKHYLKSLGCAHLHQFCNNFKDPGVQVYGMGDLFQSLQEDLDDIFEKVPPPKPSRISRRRTNTGVAANKPVSMAKTFNNRKAICVHGKTMLKVKSSVASNGVSSLPISDIRKGDEVLTSSGGFVRVECLVQTDSDTSTPFDLVKIGNLRVTPYHPINIGGTWEFPINTKEGQLVSSSDVGNSAFSVYNLVLEEGKRHNSVVMDGIETITLGHGIMNNKVLKHDYFGTDKIITDLSNVKSGWESGHIILTEKDVQRNAASGDINGIQTNLPTMLECNA